jgi:hypothetical protein
MAEGSLAKAKITNLATNTAVDCMFNPSEYTFSKTNAWTHTNKQQQNVGDMQWAGGSAGILQIELFFDTCEARSPAFQAGKDVREYTKGILEMMQIANQDGPPTCRFEWGSYWSFEGVITSIVQKFTLFASNGTPLRSTLNVTFQQTKDEAQYPAQNPTSGGHPGDHLRTIREGDTLVQIAYEEYGDSTVWRHLALTNTIRDVRRLRPGQLLIITPLAIR